MVTNLVEGARVKCEEYWPSSGREKYGPFQVTIVDQLILADYTIRTFTLEVSGGCGFRLGLSPGVSNYKRLLLCLRT